MSEATTTADAEQAIEAHYKYKKRKSENTAREYHRHIRRFRDYLEENTDVTIWNCHSGHAEDYYAWMQSDGYSPSSIRVAHASLSDFYEQVDKFGEKGIRGFPRNTPDQDPTEYATPERLEEMHTESKKKIEGGDRHLTRDELEKLINNVPAPTTRNELIVRLLYQTGMRRSEIVRVKLAHIDRQKREITVYGKKTEESRKAWYQPSLDTHLDLWINGDRNAELTADESPYLFCTSRSERMDEQVITDVVTTAAENAGIQEEIYTDRAGHSVNLVGAHTLRKTFGAHYLKDGGDIAFLMDLLGHKNIETTKDHYLSLLDEDLEDTIRKHGPSL